MENRLSQITQKILGSYKQVVGLHNTRGLPSKMALAVICEDLLRILFPGFYHESAICEESLYESTLTRVGNVARLLGHEISKSFHLERPSSQTRAAEDILCNFLSSLPQIREILSTDIQSAYEGDPAALSFEEIVLSYPFLEAIAIQRLAHLLYQDKVQLLPRMMTEWAHSRSGIDIHPGAVIGPHFFIDHGTGVVIGETCRIGEGVKLYHGVTLGARSLQKDLHDKIVKGAKRHPDVQNGVTIYPNSTILGGETTIGEQSTIGANVFLTQS
ncbi:MAG: serine acetyltransferase, partial [Verrucomicrobia bacterium]